MYLAIAIWFWVFVVLGVWTLFVSWHINDRVQIISSYITLAYFFIGIVIIILNLIF